MFLTWKREGGYTIRFYNHIFYGEFAASANLPTFRIRIQSQKLNTGNWEEIEDTVGAVADYFMSHISSVQVSRVDLALDFQLAGFEFPDVKDAVSRARRKTYDIDDKLGLEALHFGKRYKNGHATTKNLQIQCAFYNKGTAIRERQQDWMYEVYERAEGYDASLATYRVEFRFFRDMLREMKRVGENGLPCGIETIDDLKKSTGDLIREAVGDEHRRPWLRFCDPETRGRDARPAARWWASISEAFKKDLTPSDRFREPKKSVPKRYLIEANTLTGNAKAEALARLDDSSHRNELIVFPSPQREYMLRTMRLRKTTWEKEVTKHMGRLMDGMAEAELLRDGAKVA